MKRSSPYSILYGAALLAAAQAHGQHVAIKFDDNGRFEHYTVLAPGAALENCAKLAKGQSLAWSFNASKPLQFAIRYLDGKSADYPAKLQNARAAEAQLDVVNDQDYCWRWANSGEAPAKLIFRLQKREKNAER